MTAGEAGGPQGAHLLIVDDHPAVRAGLVALLEDEGALTLMPPAAGAEEALALARRQPPDIVLLDVSLEDGDGLRVCIELKRLARPPGVLLYTASADPLLGLKARLVGADGLIGKGAAAGELCDAIGAVLEGKMVAPVFDRELLRSRSAQLSPEGLAVVGLRVDSTPIDGVAHVLGLSEDEVVGRIIGLLEAVDAGPLPGDAGGSPWSGGWRTAPAD